LIEGYHRFSYNVKFQPPTLANAFTSPWEPYIMPVLIIKDPIDHGDPGYPVTLRGEGPSIDPGGANCLCKIPDDFERRSIGWVNEY
jgi:hypothetical protein